MNAHGKEDGSRDSDGNVPNVHWNPDNRKVNVNWYDPDNSNQDGGVRREVSARKIPLACGILCEISDPPIGHLGCFHEKSGQFHV